MAVRAVALPLTSWLDGQADAEMLREMLREVIDPEVGINIVDLGLVYDVHLAGEVAAVRMTLTTPGCPLGGYIDDAIHEWPRGWPGWISRGSCPGWPVSSCSPSPGSGLSCPEWPGRRAGRGCCSPPPR